MARDSNGFNPHSTNNSGGKFKPACAFATFVSPEEATQALRVHGKVEDVPLVGAVDIEIVDEVRKTLRGLANV